MISDYLVRTIVVFAISLCCQILILNMIQTGLAFTGPEIILSYLQILFRKGYPLFLVDRMIIWIKFFQEVSSRPLKSQVPENGTIDRTVIWEQAKNKMDYNATQTKELIEKVDPIPKVVLPSLPSEFMGPTSIKNITNVIKYNQTVGLKLPINSSLDGNNHLHQLLYTGKNKNLLKFVSQTVFDPSRFYLYKNISDGRVLSINWLHPTLEPSVASNGSSILLTGNHFVTKSTDGGLHWTQMNYSQDFSHNRLQILNNGGDNDVIYSNRIHKFIWYRQGQDGRFNLAVSPDLNRWNFHILVEANNLIPQLNLDTILSQNSLGPRGNCT